jgi:hypothetical protein
MPTVVVHRPRRYTVTRQASGGRTVARFGLLGPAGVGVPPGGTPDQVLKKLTDSDHDTYWGDEAGGGTAAVTFTLAVGGALAITAGVAVTVSTVGGSSVRPAVSNTAGQQAVGLAVAGASPGFACTVQTAGPLTLSGWGLTPGADYFLQPFSFGGITTMVPTAGGQYVQKVGRAISADTLLIEISDPILL